jgi:hypothetical protein
MDKILEFTSNNMWLVLALMISFFVLVFSELRRKASGFQRPYRQRAKHTVRRA